MIAARAFALILLVAAVSAHVCFVHPHQRGSMDISKPASSDCFLHTPACGGRPAETPKAFVKAGSQVQVTFNKNLNHYYPENVGNFAIGLGVGPNPTNFTLLALVPDTDMEAPIDMTAVIEIPNKKMEHAVLRTVYNTNNPDVPTFYSCADISIH